jgi:quercetin dioxygenase-like cupin family protein
MEEIQAVSIPEAVMNLPGPWEPKDLVTVNDAVVRVSRLEGEYDWHQHKNEELFLCWDGTFRIDIEDGGSIQLSPGDLLVVPAGTPHRVVAPSMAHTVLVERPGTKARGD